MMNPAETAPSTATPGTGTEAGVPTAATHRSLVPLWFAAVAVVVVGLNLRPPITAVAPLIGQIQDSLGFSSAIAGLVTSTPLLSFVLLSSQAPRIGRRFGIERTISAALVIILAGTGLRMLPGTGFLFAGMALVGVGITFGNVLLPALIKRDYAGRTGILTGLYTTALFTGPAAAAGLTLPLQRALGLDWSGALALWGILPIIGLVVWMPFLRGSKQPATGAGHLQTHDGGVSVWRQPLAWAVTLYFAVLSLVFYTANAWLPVILMDAGLPAAEAGNALSIANLAAIIPALISSIAVARHHSQIGGAVAGTLLTVAGIIGVLAAPTGLTLLWMLLLGVGFGIMTGVGFSLPLLRARGGSATAELGAMSQTIGYSMSASGPLLAGVLHDLTGSWTALLWVLLVALIVQLPAGMVAGRSGYVRH
ncbi:MFS transporter [Arthrobacter rhombi]|uniref:MFS transporter n=1 Tax=Arthrobacter rhombi TaxID=71253 RepID=UPI003FD62066